MITRFDHAILAVDSLQDSVERLRSQYGLSSYIGGSHTGLGTENAMVRFGLDYIEVLGVRDRAEVIAAGVKRASLLDFVDDMGGGWLSFAMATDDIRSLARHFQDVGLQAYGPYDMQRVRPDGVVLRWKLLVPERSAWRKPWPFFIQWEIPDNERLDVETPSSHELGECEVCEVCLIVGNLDAASYLYSEQLGFEYQGHSNCRLPGTASALYTLGDFKVDLVTPTGAGLAQEILDARGEGLAGVTLRVKDADNAERLLAEKALPVVIKYDLAVDLLPSHGKLDRARLSICE